MALARGSKAARFLPVLVHISGALLTVLIVALLSNFTIRKSLQKLSVLQEEERVLTESLKNKEMLNAALSRAQDHLAQHDAWVQKARQGLPESLDFERFYAQLAASAERREVLLTTILPDPAETRTPGGSHRIGVTIKARASFKQLSAFLFELTGMPDLEIVVDSLSVASSGEPGFCVVDLRIELLALEGVPVPEKPGEEAMAHGA